MKREEFSRYERLKVLMEDWATWCSGYRMKTGWPSRSIGMESGYVSSTFDDMMEGVEQEMMRSIDTAVDDLEPVYKAAVYRCYGLASVFRFPRGNYNDVVLLAHDELLLTLPRKGIAL